MSRAGATAAPFAKRLPRGGARSEVCPQNQVEAELRHEIIRGRAAVFMKILIQNRSTFDRNKLIFFYRMLLI